MNDGLGEMHEVSRMMRFASIPRVRIMIGRRFQVGLDGRSHLIPHGPAGAGRPRRGRHHRRRRTGARRQRRSLMPDRRGSTAAGPAFQPFAARQSCQQHLRVIGVVRGLRVDVSIAHVGVHAGGDAPHRVVDALDKSLEPIDLFIAGLQRRVKNAPSQLLLFQLHFRLGFRAQMMRHHLVVEGRDAAFGHPLQFGVKILAEQQRQQAVRTKRGSLLALEGFVENGELRGNESETVVEGSPRQGLILQLEQERLQRVFDVVETLDRHVDGRLQLLLLLGNHRWRTRHDGLGRESEYESSRTGSSVG